MEKILPSDYDARKNVFQPFHIRFHESGYALYYGGLSLKIQSPQPHHCGQERFFMQLGM